MLLIRVAERQGLEAVPGQVEDTQVAEVCQELGLQIAIGFDRNPFHPIFDTVESQITGKR